MTAIFSGFPVQVVAGTDKTTELYVNRENYGALLIV
jgi:hypothetical protein